MTDTADGEDEIELEIERDDQSRPSASRSGGRRVDERSVDETDQYREETGARYSDEATDPYGREGPYDRDDDFRDASTGRSTSGTDRDSATRRLEEELGRIDLETTEAGYVEGRITGLESIDETRVLLEVTLPHGQTEEFVLEKPIPWSTEFLLARIVEDVGYDATSLSHVVGERVYLERTDLEEEAGGGGDLPTWLTTSAHAIGEVALSALGGRFHLEERRSPEWRLVDPLERQPIEKGGSRLDLTSGLGIVLILLAPIVAAVGVGVAVTTVGGLVLSIPVAAAVVASLVVALVGFALVAGNTR
ncbi:hypothetical protein [Natrarchaeobius chitinivorans]|uniref:hypothetical protein n=1 Tax=Natrarchaeobius chitinivorans TaxID=1679083 RepID=UPI001A9F5368|nr:hypothetical protein [Natrarchaeobius chitinivorans]